MDRDQNKAASEREVPGQPSSEKPEPADQDEDAPNPPRTTTRKITSPKFGSAGSGGAEIEPGLKRD